MMSIYSRYYQTGFRSEQTPNEQILKNLFDHFDKNGDSTIDIHELKVMFDAAGRVMTEKQLADLTRGFDHTTGVITFDEFAEVMTKFNLDHHDSKNLLDFWLETTRNEVKDAKILFERVWKKVTLDGKTIPHLPAKLLFLGGSPGAGKGTNSEFIMKIREVTSPPIVISSLLVSAAAKQRKDSGMLVGDSEVLQALLEELSRESYSESALIDGFPRTPIQAECVKLLYDELVVLHKKNSHRWEKPIFRAIMLYVDEKESVNRQLQRGREVLAHNQHVLATGLGEVLPIRQTDIDIAASRKRFKTFLDETFKALTLMRGFFPFSFIDAHGSLERVRENINKELAYQSSLELNSETYHSLKHLPTANDVLAHSRQSLVKRLEDYQSNNQELFEEMIGYLAKEIYPIVRMHAMSGSAAFISYAKVFEDIVAVQMVLDVLSDRGFTCVSEKYLDYIKFNIVFHKNGVNGHEK
jgi:adenylate kinase